MRILLLLVPLCLGFLYKPVIQEVKNQGTPDTYFLAMLRSAGIIDAAREIGLDFDKYLGPLAKSVNHNYRRYRWSAGHHPEGGIMISAMPPEEEAGWTPWEIWFRDKSGKVRKESRVLYPLKVSGDGRTATWYKIDENGLYPRYLKEPVSLEDKLSLHRIYEAASVIGFDAGQVLLKPLNEAARDHYMKCRWVIIPHMLSNDTPVIYILPPMNMSDAFPWESWYTEKPGTLLHHVHYTRKNDQTTGVWKEYPGAPQRPPEIFGVTWYWFDDQKLLPAVLKP